MGRKSKSKKQKRNRNTIAADTLSQTRLQGVSSGYASHETGHVDAFAAQRRALLAPAPPIAASYLGAPQQRLDAARGLLPLTDRNLQTLLEQSGTGSVRPRFEGVALDMELFARQQQQLRGNYGDADAHDAYSAYSRVLRPLLLEFGALNPPLDHLSDLTSLDDVCFPDYYEVLLDGETSARPHVWPELHVLEEFIAEERDAQSAEDRLDRDSELSHASGGSGGPQRPHALDAQGLAVPGVNFSFPVARRVPDYEILPTDELSPLLGDTVPPELGALSLRVRPRQIQPWEKSAVPQRLHSDALARFTYFREDMERTVHAATLGGLVDAHEAGEQDGKSMTVGERLQQLFSPPHYGHSLIHGDTPSPGSEAGTATPHDTMGSTNAQVAQNAPGGTNGSAAEGSSSGASGSAGNGGSATPAGDSTPATEASANRPINGLSSTLCGTAAAAQAATGGAGFAVNAAVQVNGVRTLGSGVKTSPMPPSVQSGGTVPATTANSVIAPRHTPPFWLDILDPLEEEMKVLSKTFGLHPLTTEDIFLGETREKVELFRQYYFICFTSFDIVYERRKQRAKEHEKKAGKMLEYSAANGGGGSGAGAGGLWRRMRGMFGRGLRSSRVSNSPPPSTGKRARSGELCPLNMYMIIFKHGVLTFHFSATPHPINVRRRARMLKDHLTVSTDWICYALIDDITDSFAPMIDSIETEVYLIEDEIMKMHLGDLDTDDLDSDALYDDDDDDEYAMRPEPKRSATSDVFYRRQRSKSIVEPPEPRQFVRRKRGSRAEYSLASLRSRSSRLSSSKSTLSKIVAWKRKGDMLRRIGECRKRVMSVMRLLGSKADVIKGFSKRFNENESISPSETPAHNARLALRQEILMYLGDIQDHIVTMVQSLNHYEKLLARSHSNYLAQINIDMTKVNNDMNDVLGKITILGTIVLPINVVTGLWGMNCIVPGQDHEGLVWFWGILVGIFMFSMISYIYAKKVTGL